MRIISLNIWGGRCHDALLAFFSQQANTTDIFCLQEVWHTPTSHSTTTGDCLTIFDEIAAILPGFTGYFAPAQDNYVAGMGKTDFPVSFGQAMFVKHGITIDGHGDLFVFGERNARNDTTFTVNPKNLQYLRLHYHDEPLTIMNFHGLWLPGTAKADLPERLEQSHKVKAFIDNEPGQKILIGDFNLLPDGESLRILETEMRNLIREYGITSTRSELYEKELRYADYCLSSAALPVTDFRVLPDVVSDHLALQLDLA